MRNVKNAATIVLSTVLAIAIIGTIIYGTSRPKEAPPANVPTKGNAEVIVQEKVVEKLVKVEREITAEIIEEGIRDMGFLVTQEYNFTEVIDFKKNETKWGFINAKSGFIASYDGLITAGIDFEKIKVSKSESSKTIYIVLPAAEIAAIDVDPESFVLYSETSTWGGKVTAEEFNKNLIALENNAKEKAIDKGLLTRAGENAETILRNFVGSLVDTSEYTINISIR